MFVTLHTTPINTGGRPLGPPTCIRGLLPQPRYSAQHFSSPSLWWECLISSLVSRLELLLQKASKSPFQKTAVGGGGGDGEKRIRAVEIRHEAVVKLLLESLETEADTRDESGMTPLSLAAEKQHMGVMTLFLETKC